VRHRSPIVISMIAVSAVVAATVGAISAASASSPARAPERRSLPTISGKAEPGNVLRASSGRWRRAHRLRYVWERCNAKGARCKVIPGRNGGHRSAVRMYKLVASDTGHRLRVTVRATNAWGATSATSRPTAVVMQAGAGSPQSPPNKSPITPSPPLTVPPPVPIYFSTVPSSETGLPPAGIPRPDATCAAEVTPAPENRPQNTTANHSVPSDPAAIQWSPSLDYWTDFIADRNRITGDFVGTTDEILQWVACKWGIDEDIVRADAVIESYWNQSTVGDNCGVAGEASYGILQVKNEDCSGTSIHGGWPYTQDDTALDADYWGARLRACFDGAFYNGGQWLYDGQNIAQVISAHGQDYALWGCIGSWFSGSWYDSGAQGYIAKVQSDYESKPWLKPGF
jgi:hypothetical protein